MGLHAFIAYSIKPTDTHMVYELGDLMEKQGYTAVYNYDHPEHPRGQHAYDEVAMSGLFVGLITAGNNSKQVLQLWQYARSQGIPTVLLHEEGLILPGNLPRDRNIIAFRRYMPENPIRYVELWISHHFR